MPCPKVILYFFSGTGNAKNVAFWLNEVTDSLGINCSVIDLGKLENRRNIHIEPGALYGFVAPTHGFNFPPVMFHFLLHLPQSKQNQAFIMNTRAGMKAGKLFLPGLSGMAQYFSAFLLWLKGYKIVGMQPVDLPSNWISLHPGLKPKVVESIYKRQKEKVTRFALRIFSGKRSYRALFDLIQDLLITPIAFGYYAIGRFLLAKSFVASSACTNCGLCIKQCPVKAIKEKGNRPFWTISCESCMKCMNACPQRAIETAHGFFIGMIILVNLTLLVFVYQSLHVEAFLSESLPGFLKGLTRITLSSGIYFLVMIVSYRILHWLMRYNWFEKLIIFTSLTHYKFWRRYKPGKFI